DHDGIIPACRRQPLTIRTEGRGKGDGGVSAQRGEDLAGAWVPNNDRSIVARGRQALAIRTESEAIYFVGVPGERAEYATGSSIPNGDDMIFSAFRREAAMAGGKPFAVRAEYQIAPLLLYFFLETLQFATRCRVPDFCPPVFERGQPFAVGTNGSPAASGDV